MIEKNIEPVPTVIKPVLENVFKAVGYYIHRPSNKHKKFEKNVAPNVIKFARKVYAFLKKKKTNEAYPIFKSAVLREFRDTRYSDRET